MRSVALRRRALMILASIGLDALSASYGQTYPSKVIRIVVPTGPGTPPDVISRVIGAELSESEGWRVVHQEPARCAANDRNGRRPETACRRLFHLSDERPQPWRCRLCSRTWACGRTQTSLRSSRFRSHTTCWSYRRRSRRGLSPELVSVLREGPDRFNFSSAGFGTPAHLIGEMFKLQTGARATHVPYQQAQQRVADLLNGINQFDFLATVTAADFLATGATSSTCRHRSRSGSRA